MVRDDRLPLTSLGDIVFTGQFKKIISRGTTDAARAEAAVRSNLISLWHSGIKLSVYFVFHFILSIKHSSFLESL